MVVLGVAWSVAVLIITVVVIVNFCYVLFTAKSNSKLTEFGHSLASYLYQVAEFMTFNTETRPFPIDEDWPSGKSNE